MEKIEENESRWFLELGAAIVGVLIGAVLIWFVVGCGPESAESRTKRAAPAETVTTTTAAPAVPTTTCPPVEPAEPVQ